VKITINRSALNEPIRKAFADTALIVGGEFTKAITDPVYPWPRGESPRDVVDTGRLRSSQRLEISGLTATYSWPVEYSLIAHSGAVLRNGTVLPPRPWTARAFANRPPATIFELLVRSYAQ
jgi:hypothetical protein